MGAFQPHPTPIADITFNLWGSGCGASGRVVGFNTRDPRFESRYSLY